MANPNDTPKLRPLLLVGAGALAVGLILSGVYLADARRGQVSEAELAGSTAAVARMDAAQARHNAARTEAQKRVYKGY